jgi:hypothetical protein
MTILYSINYCSVCGPVFRLLLCVHGGGQVPGEVVVVHVCVWRIP